MKLTLERLALLLWTAALVAASLQTRRPGLPRTIAMHHSLHVITFMVGTALTIRSLPRRLMYTLSIPAAISLGIFIEVAQHTLFHLPIEWDDIAADTLGVFLTALLFAVFAHQKAPKSALTP